MIARLTLTLHLEWHRHYGFTISLRREPRPGDRLTDAGQPGTLQRCPLCSGDGTLHHPDTTPATTTPGR